MAVSSYRVHATHNALGGSSFASQAASFTHLPNVSFSSYSSRQGRGSQLSVLATRTNAAYGRGPSPSSLSSSPAAIPVTRTRRGSVRIPTPTPVPSPVATRRPPPPPPRSSGPSLQDPFADQPLRPQVGHVRSAHSAPPLIASRTRIPSVSAPAAPPPGLEPTELVSTSTCTVPESKDPRGRFVANALLNRSNGKPMRRRLSDEGELDVPVARTYVRSRLSRAVPLES